MKRISTFTLLAALGGLQGCITHAPPTCPDGLCDVGFAPLVPRDPRRVDIRPTGQHVPANAIAMGRSSSRGARSIGARTRCSIFSARRPPSSALMGWPTLATR